MRVTGSAGYDVQAIWRRSCRVPTDHPLRTLRPMVDEALGNLGVFDARYANGRSVRRFRPRSSGGVDPAAPLTAWRSERQLMEQPDYNLLFRWFVGLNADEPVWDASTFSKNRDLAAGAADRADVSRASVGQARTQGSLSAEHFTVDGSPDRGVGVAQELPLRTDEIAGRVGHRRMIRGIPRLWTLHGERRSNATHASTTDPDARLASIEGRRGTKRG